MKKTAIILLLTLFAVFSTGCIKDLLYEVDGNSVTFTDPIDGESLTITESQAKSMGFTHTDQVVDYARAVLARNNPKEAPVIKNKDLIVESEEKIKVKDEVSAGLSFLKYVPYGDTASVALNGLLAMGALWFGKKKKVSDKVAESLIKGVDTFRDVLDQTSGGDKIDAVLKESLSEHQKSLGVLNKTTDLINRYKTPTKPKGGIDLS